MRRSRITGRFKPGRVDLFAAAIKSAPHVRAEATKRAQYRAKVWAVKAALDRELGR